MLRLLTILICLLPAWSPAPAQGGPYPPVNHPRDRHYDVLNYRLTLDADLVTKTVSGEAEITLVPIVPMLDVVRLDAAVMTVSRVKVDGAPAEFSHAGDTLSVPLGKLRTPADTLTVTVAYSVTDPPKGLYFSGPDESEPDKPYQLYSQGESMENHFWIPCYDFPNDKATSEMIVTVKTGFTAISNGRFLGAKKDLTGEHTTFHWKESLPHVSYLISLVVGEYELVADEWRGKPIMNYVYKSNAADAPRSFEKTPAMMDFFSDLTGYPYPWEKYGHAIVQDFIYGGQENVTISTLTDNTIHDSRAHLDRNSDGLVAHELAHQWFGDLVSFRDWSEAWLSEGFATYLTLLSEGHDKGEEEFSYQLKQTQDNVVNADVGDRRRPTVTKRYVSPENLFDNRIYGKGACVLNMLRKTVGDGPFLKSLRRYVSEYAFTSVETNQFRLVTEEVTGMNLDWFFDQWVYGAGYPKFDVSTRWDQALRAVTVRVAQTQETDSLTGVFRTPVEIQVWVNGNPESYTEMITDTVHEFSFPAYQEPQLVIFDRGSDLLKTAVFPKGTDQWIYQLSHAADVADRVAAVSELRWTVDTPAVKAALTEAMIGDRYWGVRYEAALALADSKSSRPETEMNAAYGDRDARVRGAVMRALGNFGGEEAVRTLRHAFESDSSYRVIANALAALVKCDSVNSRTLCIDGLTRSGVDDEVRNAALRGLATYTRVEGTIDTLTAYSRPGKPRNLRVLAVSLLARHREDDDVMEYLIGLLDDRSFHVRRAVIDNLGRSGYEDALTPLRRRLVEEPNTRLQQAIREAIDRLEKTIND